MKYLEMKIDTQVIKHTNRYDKSGRSTMKVIGYTLGKDDIQIQCTDWHESMEMYDSLSFMLFTEEWMSFLNNEAY